MATRQTRLIIKNSVIPSQTLPSSGVLQGEGLVNIGDGILFFTGGTAGSPTWVDSGNATSGYFEVGSNLNQLKIRDKIISYSGVTNLTGKFLSGTTSGFVLADTSSIVGVDRYVTGSTLTSATNNTNSQSSLLNYNIAPVGGPYSIVTENTFTTGATFNSGTTALNFSRNDGVSYSVTLSGLGLNDTYVTGFTYNPSTNTFTVSQNQGQPPLTAQISTVSGLSLSNLTSGRVVYVGSGGLLTDEAGFTYNDGTNTLGVQNIDASGDVTVQGSLTVFGPSISAFTSQLYVEDPNVIFNYNPTGNTTVTSVNAGLTIQDGNGVNGGSVNFDIVRMQNLTGLTSTQIPNVSEYTALTGFANRGWITQLNDIVIRSTDVSDGGSAGDINGVRVLAEFDILDGGTY